MVICVACVLLLLVLGAKRRCRGTAEASRRSVVAAVGFSAAAICQRSVSGLSAIIHIGPARAPRPTALRNGPRDGVALCRRIFDESTRTAHNACVTAPRPTFPRWRPRAHA